MDDKDGVSLGLALEKEHIEFGEGTRKRCMWSVVSCVSSDKRSWFLASLFQRLDDRIEYG
jgi:hypothetical protein